MINDNSEKSRRADEILKLIASAQDKQSLIDELLLKAQQLKDNEKKSFRDFEISKESRGVEITDETVISLQIVRRTVYKMA